MSKILEQIFNECYVCVMWYCVETPDLYVIVARAFGINPHKYDSLRMKERRLRQTLQKFLEVCVRSAFERFDDFFSTG